MSDHTITIPVPTDPLGTRWSQATLRHWACRLRTECFHGPANLIDLVADEIERQAPRAEGWYLVTYRAYGENRERVIYWTGHDWRLASYPSAERVADPESADTITPVTIGRADS